MFMAFQPCCRNPRGPSSKCGYPRTQTPRVLVRAATAADTADTSAQARPPDDAVALLKKACKDPSVPPKAVFQALRRVQKAKFPAAGWDKVIASGKIWRLVYQADASSVQSNLKDEQAGSGRYFPIIAGQRFELTDAPQGRLENGVYLPHIAAFKFGGPFTMKAGERKLEFTYDEIVLKLGPWQLGPFKINMASKPPLPFFIFFYADEDIICAQGKSGGVAIWESADGTWLLERGIA